MIVYRGLKWNSFAKSGVIKASHQILYGVISETEKYPQFIPWCDQAKIIQKISQYQNKTQLTVSFKKFRSLKYISTVYLHPATNQQEHSTVHSICHESPLKELDSLWQIRTLSPTNCTVNYTLHFEFDSPFYQLASSIMINYLGEQMWTLFEKQAINLQSKSHYIEKSQEFHSTSNNSKQKEESAHSLEQFLQNNPEMGQLYLKNDKFKRYMMGLHKRLQGSFQYEAKMKFQARNWLAHNP